MTERAEEALKTNLPVLTGAAPAEKSSSKKGKLWYGLVRPRWRKVLSDLGGNRLRSLMVILSIAAGVFAVGMITTLYVVITDDMRTSYRAISPANIVISAQPYKPEFLDTIRELDDIQDAQGVWQFTARVKLGPDEWKTINLKAIYDIDTMSIDRPLLLEGAWPPKERQVVFDQYKLAETGAKIGDTIEIELPSGRTRQLEVVGVVQDQSIGATDSGGFFVSPPIGYISFDTLEWLEQPERLNKLYATVTTGKEDEDHLRSMALKVSDKLDQSNYPVYSTAARRSDDHPNSLYTQAISGLLFVLGFLVVFLSAFLITNTLSGLLNQQTHQIGVIKTLGGRRGQIIVIYMSLIFVFSLLALALALLFSGQVSFLLLMFLSRQINFILQGYRVVPVAVILQVAIALVVPQVAGIVPILHGSQITVQEALNGEYSEGGEQKKSRTLFLTQYLPHLPRPLLISLRNTFRHKLRLVLTLVTLVLGGAIFIATFNVQTSLTQQIDRMSKYFAADVSITFDRPQRVSKIQQIAYLHPAVRDVEGWASAAGEIVNEDGTTGESVHILAPPNDSQMIEPYILAGRWVAPGDQNAIALNERFMSRFPNLKVGDPIRLKIDGKEREFVVVGFFQFAGKSGGYLAYGSHDYLATLVHTSNHSIVFRIAADVDGDTLSNQKQLGQELEALFQDRGYNIIEVSPGKSLLDSAASGLNILTAFLLMLATLTAAVGSIGLTGTMSMNVLERTREIGIMRAIGASDRIVMTLVIVEGLVIGLISWVLGSLLAFPISKVMADIVSYSLFDSPANFTYSLHSFAIWFVLVFILSVVACVIPARNAARLTIREVLAYE